MGLYHVPLIARLSTRYYGCVCTFSVIWHWIDRDENMIKECVMSFMFLSVLDSQLRPSWSSIMTTHYDWYPTPTVTGGIRDSSLVCRIGILDHG